MPSSVAMPQLPPFPPGRALLAFALAWAAFTWPWMTGAVTVPWDAKAHFYPQILFMAQAFHEGESPFWAPFVFAGHPQAADPQSLLTSPPFLALAMLDALPSFRTVDMVVFAMLGFGGIAVLFIARDRGWHWSGAVVAAILFCFGGSAAWRIQHVGQILSLAWAPITFLFLDRALRRPSLPYALAAGITGAFMILGRDQVALLAAYLLAGYVLAFWIGSGRILRTVGTTLPRLVAGGVVAVAIAAVPLTLSVLFGAQSNRPAIDYASAGAGSLHPVHLLTLVAADLYGSSGPMADVWGPPSFAWPDTGLFLAQNMFVLYMGALPLLLLIGVGVVRGALWESTVRPFTIGALLMLLYALGWYTPLFRIAYETLPGIALFRRPADATFLFGALTALCVGYLVHRVVTDTVPPVGRARRAAEIAVAAGSVIAAIALAAQAGRLFDNAFMPVVTAVVSVTGALLALGLAVRLRRRAPGLAGLVIAGALLGDLAWSNGPTPSTAMPPAEMDVLRPDTRDPVIGALFDATEEGRSETRRDRVEMVGLGFFWPNSSLVHGLEHTLGYNPLRIGTTSAATGAIDTIAVPDQRQFPPLFPSYRSELADLLGLRFIVTPEPIEVIDRRLPPGALPLIGRPGGRYLYENTRALPRVVLATRAVAVDQNDLIRTGRWPAGLDFTSTVVLDDVPQDVPAVPDMPGRARIVDYHNTVVLVEATAPPGGGWLVLHDAWHPWWYADIDGQETPVLRANAMFRAVRVPEGQTRVRFTFRPFRGAAQELRARLGRV